MKRIKIDRKKCIGCLTCTTACKVAHECVYACPTGAMQKDNETGYALYDKSRCATCFMCIMACPYGVLKMDYQTNREVMKCDMCLTVKEQTPQCAAKCPMGALTLQEVES